MSDNLQQAHKFTNVNVNIVNGIVYKEGKENNF